MFTKLTNMTGKIKYALYGVKLMLKISYFYTNTNTETFVSHITCVIDVTSLKTMLDIDQPLLQFIDVMNLVDLLLHFSPSFVVKRVQICAVGCQRCGEMKAGLVYVVPEGWLSLTLGEQQQESKEYGTNLTHCKHVAFESEACHGSMHHWTRWSLINTIDLHSSIDEYQVN